MHDYRRKLILAVLAMGGAAGTVPQRWTKPVVHHVFLPAHAQASETADDQDGEGEAPATIDPDVLDDIIDLILSKGKPR